VRSRPCSFFRNSKEDAALKLQTQEFKEMVSSFPGERRPANPAAAGGTAQPPARNDNATPNSAVKPDHLPRGVAWSGRGDVTDDLMAAPAPSFNSWAVGLV